MPRFTQEQLLLAYRKAPEPIQDAFGGEIMVNVVNDIRARYRLHVDIAGGLEQEIGYLMLGLVSPAEFFGTMMLSGTDEQTARGIMDEVNNRLFIPLKNQMRTGAQAPVPTESYVAIPAVAEERPQLVSTPVIAYVPPDAPTMLPGSSIAAPMPQSAQAVHAGIPVTAPVSAPAYVPPAPPPISAYVPPQPVIAPAPTKPAPAIPIQKEYGADPYREAI